MPNLNTGTFSIKSFHVIPLFLRRLTFLLIKNIFHGLKQAQQAAMIWDCPTVAFTAPFLDP